VKAYKKWLRFSPFYIRNHPEESQLGGSGQAISMIQNMSSAKGSSPKDMMGQIENIFGKNEKKFDGLVD
jgi:hypothetical protein